jgi:GDP/UDP-N,N'-diacetylbacillosamine 2-epimerase (hydrolysing)
MGRRRIVFVTGTRAELGLMVRTLEAIRRHPKLSLGVVATGMHLDPAYGEPLGALRASGVEVDAVVPWEVTRGGTELAEAVGEATAELARVYAELGADGVLVVGDRVEVLAAAVAAAVARIPVAHVHGGDRAEGQVDDSIRHAVTKLSHLHLAACADSARRIVRLGEEKRNVVVVGAPGVEGIVEEAEAGDTGLGDAVLVLRHPVCPDEAVEYAGARRLLRAIRAGGAKRVVLIAPNNDPGAGGIRRAWKESGLVVSPGVGRGRFLAMLRDVRLLAGNSSAGIIEAGSFGTAVLDIGPRQAGRLRGGNVTTVADRAGEISSAVRRLLGRKARYPRRNVYARPGTAEVIAGLLAGRLPDVPAGAKLITY